LGSENLLQKMELDYDFDVDLIETSDVEHMDLHMEELDVKTESFDGDDAESFIKIVIGMQKTVFNIFEDDKYGSIGWIVVFALFFALLHLSYSSVKLGMGESDLDSLPPIDLDIKSLHTLLKIVEDAINKRRNPEHGILNTISKALHCIDEILDINNENYSNGSIKSYSQLSPKDLHELEAILSRIEAILSKCAQLVKSDNKDLCVDLNDYLSEVNVLKRITQLSIELEKIKDAIQGSLNSHVRNSLSKVVFDLQNDFGQIQKLQSADIPNQLEMELTTRRIVCSIELLRVYDRYGDYEELRSQALAYIQSAHAHEDEILRKLHSNSTSNSNSNNNSSDNIELITLGSDTTSSESSHEIVTNKTIESNESETSMGVGIVTSVLGSSSTAVSTSGNIGIGNVAWQTTQYQKQQQRLEQRHKAECDAETRYRRDEQSERDEKSRLASISVQRSMLRNSESSIFTQRSKELQDAFYIELVARKRFDTFMFFVVGLISAAAYIAVTFGCDDGRSLSDLLSSKMMDACECFLKDASVVQKNEVYTVGYINKVFQDHLKNTSLYESARKAVTQSIGSLTETILGVNVASLGEVAGLMKCITKLMWHSLLPILLSKVLMMIDLPQMSSSVLIFAFLYGIVLPLLSVEGLLRQFCILLAIQGLSYLFISIFDAKLRWIVSFSKRDRGTNVRIAMMYILYPILCIVGSLFIACSVSTQGFSRGLKVGHKQSLFTCSIDTIKKCLM
jgi:hypothetical protein